MNTHCGSLGRFNPDFLGQSPGFSLLPPNCVSLVEDYNTELLRDHRHKTPQCLQLHLARLIHAVQGDVPDRIFVTV